MTNTYDMRNDKPDEVRSLFLAAQRRKEERIKFQLLTELLDGKVVDITKSKQLFEALNREKMEFEEILKFHPDQVKTAIECAKESRELGYKKNKARRMEIGFIPECCYYARPPAYWANSKLKKNFLNTFTKFRVTERAL